nr:putative reverse transcriptase domain-containing protein [Tanacetum cinerariifolium]
RLKTARIRHKSYVDNRKKPLEFQTGDNVLLEVSPWKGMIRFGKRGKLNPRFVGTFKVLGRVGPVTYLFELPHELSGVHDVVHVSNLKKCLTNETFVVSQEAPKEIMDREVKRLKHSRILIVYVQWNSRRGPEFTWKREDEIKHNYPHLFSSEPLLEGTN